MIAEVLDACRLYNDIRNKGREAQLTGYVIPGGTGALQLVQSKFIIFHQDKNAFLMSLSESHYALRSQALSVFKYQAKVNHGYRLYVNAIGPDFIMVHRNSIVLEPEPVT